MEKQTIRLDELRIEKMPGLPKGLPAFAGLNPHINIFFGRNGSGKSSTARAIQALIWRNTRTNLQAETRATIGNEQWYIRLEAGTPFIQRKGMTVEALPVIPAPETAKRYLLSLDELIANNDLDLAKEIIRQSVGGYDLDKAGIDLKYAYGANTKAASPYKEWEYASQEYDRLNREQQALQAEEGRLSGLYKNREEGEKAKQMAGWYEKIAGWFDTKQKLDQATGHIAEFPVELEVMNGDEYDTLLDLNRSTEQIDKSIENAGDEILKNESIRIKSGFPATGLPSTLIPELEKSIALLLDNEKEFREKEKEMAGAAMDEQEMLSRLGLGKAPAAWSGVLPADIDILDEELRKHHETLSDKQALESLINLFTKEISSASGATIEQIDAGIRILSAWLQEPPSANPPNGVFWLFIGLGYACALLTTVQLWIGILSILLLTLAIYWSIGRRRANSSGRIGDYEKLPLPKPAAWDRESVSKTMEQLIVDWRRMAWKREVETGLTYYKDQRNSLEIRIQAAQEVRTRLNERYKAIPEAPQENYLRSFDALHWFLKRVEAWEKARLLRLKLAAEKEAISVQGELFLKKINGLFAAGSFGNATDGPSAAALLSLLKEVDKAWRSAETAIAHARDKLVSAQAEKGVLESKIRSLYSRAGLPEGDDQALRQRAGQKRAFQEAVTEKHKQTALYKEKLDELQMHSLYASLSTDIDNLYPDKVRQIRDELTVKIEDLKKVEKDIHEIEFKIGAKKREAHLQNALSKKTEAVQGLEALYESNLAAITGKMILEAIKKKTGDENQPAVFKRAKTLFNTITAGRYELIEPESGGDPLFRAHDTVLRRGQSLAELSTGTRIQLLLSVRLAFIELQEQGLALPILADELLATTDQQRAEAIIQALAEISREGRQVFYFTAQKEEVNKWLAFAERHPDLSVGVWELDLGGSEGHQLSTAPTPEIPVFRFVSDAPDPLGRSHAEYGLDLDVAPFDLLADDPASLPLWYMVEDPLPLAAMLRRGFSRWGELSSFIDINGVLPDGVGDLIPSIKALAGLLQQYQALYRQGRAIPIDRSVLDDSGAITQRFREEVAQLLKAQRNNPRELLRHLRNKAIRGFQAANADFLEKYLLQEGYIDERQVIPQDDIQLRLKVFIIKSDLDPALAERFLERIRTHRPMKNA
ncbi:MAG: hypothetical protein P4L51_01855 [Puia sp.]|nr:hypothetical protein [Puia sp.]